MLGNPSFSSSLPLKVLQERYVWAEDAGCSWGHVGVCSLWSEARYLALQLHSVQELHREVAHMKTTRLQSVRDVNERCYSAEIDYVIKIGYTHRHRYVCEYCRNSSCLCKDDLYFRDRRRKQ